MSTGQPDGVNRTSALPRSIGYWTATSVVIANVIGSGIFRSPAGVAQRVESKAQVRVYGAPASGCVNWNDNADSAP